MINLFERHHARRRGPGGLRTRPPRIPSARPLAAAGLLQEIAPGVHLLRTGRGLTSANVYFVRSGTSWVLIDAAWPNRGRQIKEAAESLFGAGARPAAILLTHLHPDHQGSARELVRAWDTALYVHPDEMPLAAGTYLPEYGNPLDRWLVVPMLRLVPRHTLQAAQAKNSLVDVALPFESDAVPGLPDWEWVHTPGHTPGHTAFLRRADGVLMTGDAVLPIDLNTPWRLWRKGPRLYGPPYISTWRWPLAMESIAALAGLEPRVLAPGHGRPMSGGVTRALRDLANG